MWIKSVEVCNFRNIIHTQVNPGPGVNLILGKNAQGKTNFLEALFLLANWASFRSVRDKDLVMRGRDSYNIQSIYCIKNRIMRSKLEYSAFKGKSFKINDKKTSQYHQDRLKVVLFTPEDLYIIKGSPERRRIFLDLILCQLSVDYNQKLQNYTKVVKKRNILLKSKHFDNRTLGILNDMLVENAIPLIMARINLVSMLEKEILQLYKQLSGENNEIKIKYALSFVPHKTAVNPDSLSDSLKKAINNNREKDFNRRTTLLGPHRDDLNIYLQDKNARTQASQGQQRNLAVALKMAEVLIIRQVKGYYPILLLDEVLAELDEQRNFLLLNYLRDSGFQTFLSSVNREIAGGNYGKTFVVNDGKIAEEV